MIDRILNLLPFHWPYPHFMAMAPIDVWFRLLHRMQWRIHWRYWPRLAAGLFTSCIGTAATLPERLILAPLMRLAYSRRSKSSNPPSLVIILGYYRTGTTHLHYLLSTNPAFVTPRWYHALAPHGFLVSWAFLRLFLVPFMSARRPQDDVAYGPEWPAEDDFALNNLALASSLPGRLIAPQHWNDFRRFDDPPQLDPKRKARWRLTQWTFVWKLRASSRRRVILLKTPSHTGRVGELLDLFGRENVKFIHLSRSAHDVVRSNVAMLQRLRVHHLENGPGEDALRARVVCEYNEMEQRYMEMRPKVPEDHLVEVRYEDLRADPVGTLDQIHDGLNLPLNDDAKDRALIYLRAVADYRPRADRDEPSPDPDPSLQWLSREFGHDRPAKTPVLVPAVSNDRTEAASGSRWRPWIAAFLTAIGCAMLWLVVANLVQNRYDTLVWPTGIAIGYAVLRSVSAGSMRLGLAAAGLTLLVLLVVTLPNTRTIYYANVSDVPWRDLWDTSWLELTTGPTLFWTFMGMVTAYRFASRSAVRPPGS